MGPIKKVKKVEKAAPQKLTRKEMREIRGGGGQDGLIRALTHICDAKAWVACKSDKAAAKIQSLLIGTWISS